MPLARFPAPTPEALYEGVKAIPWEEHLGRGRCLAVHLDSAQSQINHSRFGALKSKDAIVDRFRERTGTRPDVRVQRPDLQIQIYLHRDQATVSLDLSGESLHRRGYREQGSAAPIKENLAAAILLRAGWPRIASEGGALLDPMCGSGTLPIEGALISADIAPGLLHPYWGFLGWSQHQPAIWNRLISEARERRAVGLDRLGSIRGYDQNPQAVRIALVHLERAGLAGRLHFERREPRGLHTRKRRRPRLGCGQSALRRAVGHVLGSSTALLQVGQLAQGAFPRLALRRSHRQPGARKAHGPAGL